MAERGEFLPEGHRNRILKLRSPHLDDVRELAAFVEERAGERGHCLPQRVDRRV